jgi:hypothetical protein
MVAPPLTPAKIQAAAPKAARLQGPLIARTCIKSSCVTGSFMASLLISRISLGVLPAMRRRMPFIAASLRAQGQVGRQAGRRTRSAGGGVRNGGMPGRTPRIGGLLPTWHSKQAHTLWARIPLGL